MALLLPTDSAWRNLFDSKDDQSLITLTGFHRAFEILEIKFRPYFYEYTPYGSYGYVKLKGQQCKGRNRLINTKDCLGLVLA